MPRYSERLVGLPEYPMAGIPAKKRELVARGVDVIDLGPGDADLAPPEAAVKRLAEAAANPVMSRYGFGLGLMEYREAVVRWMRKRFGVEFDPLREIVPLLTSKRSPPTSCAAPEYSI